MAYYCGECAVWQGSSDKNRYGERWCSYSRRYEKSDQNTYGCKGFVEGGNKSSSSSCFLTTACVEHKGLPDNCHELTAMRSVRDNWLAHQPGGKEEIEEYYRIAPGIVEKINARADSADVWEYVYAQHILPCVKVIDEERYAEAVELYRKMVRELQKME